MPGFNGAFLIVEERRRQIEELGYNPDDDMRYRHAELADAARCYIEAPGPDAPLPAIWPWPAEAWKPGERKDNLVRAAALIAAELDRLETIAERKARAAALMAEAAALEAD